MKSHFPENSTTFDSGKLTCNWSIRVISSISHIIVPPPLVGLLLANFKLKSVFFSFPCYRYHLTEFMLTSNMYWSFETIKKCFYILMVFFIERIFDKEK